MYIYSVNMDLNYLNWIKKLDTGLHGRTDIHNLLFSSVSQPTQMIFDHFDQFQKLAQEYSDVSNVWGHPLLRQAIAKRYNVSYDQVMPANGASNAIYLVCRGLVTSDDHVIVERPFYEPLMASASFIGAGVSFIERHAPDYQIDPDELQRLIKPNTKLIILSNNHNPTGALLSDDALLEIARAAKSQNEHIRIVVDEIYHEFLENIPRPAVTLDDCFITINSLTKVYGLGMVHCGWIIADPSTIEHLYDLHTIVEGTNSRLADAFSIYLIEHLNEYHKRTVSHMKANYEILSQYLQELLDKEVISGNLPQSGCVYFPKVTGETNTDTLVQNLAERYQIYLVPGKYFAGPEHIRIGFGGEPERLGAALDILAKALTALL